MSSSSADLIARAVSAQDHAAFGALVGEHQSAVRRFLRHLTRGDAALADDLAQETFLQAYRSLSRFRGDASFLTWLLGIAHNQWRNARRRIRDTVPLDDAAHDTAASPESPARTADLQHDLAAALEELTADERLAVHLAFQQGLSHSEIAALLEQPLGTVKTHLARGKEKLRHLLVAWSPHS